MSDFYLTDKEINTLKEIHPDVEFLLSKNGHFLIMKFHQAIIPYAALRIPGGYGYGMEPRDFYLCCKNEEKKISSYLITVECPLKQLEEECRQHTWGHFIISELKKISLKDENSYFGEEEQTLTHVSEQIIRFQTDLISLKKNTLEILKKNSRLKNLYETFRQTEEEYETAFEKEHFFRQLPHFL